MLDDRSAVALWSWLERMRGKVSIAMSSEMKVDRGVPINYKIRSCTALDVRCLPVSCMSSIV